MSLLAPDRRAFFTDRLITPATRQPAHDRRLSRHAPAPAAASRKEQTGKAALATCSSHDLDAPLIGAFLNHLEGERGNSVRTRNARLAAIHSFYRYAALRHPEHARDDRARARDSRRSASDARADLLPRRRPRSTRCCAAPDRSTWLGTARPRAATGRDPDRAARLRAGRPALSETCSLGTGAHVRCDGKGTQGALCTLTDGHDRRACMRSVARRTRRPGRRARCSPASRGQPLTPRRDRPTALAKHTSTAAAQLPLAAGASTSPRTCCATPPPCTPARPRRRRLP